MNLLAIGDCGLGIGDWAQSPIPNPQSPNPKPPNPIPKSKKSKNILLFFFSLINIKKKKY